jgi:hypothetical protein
MATFQSIDPSLIEVGRPLKKEIAQQLICNDDSLNNRLLLVEAGAVKVTVVNQAIGNLQQYSSSNVKEGMFFYVADRNFSLVQAVCSQIEAGTSGVTQFDLLKSTTGFGGTFTSVFATQPSVDFSAGNGASSTNVIFSSTEVNQGDILRLDITSLQLPTKTVHFEVFGEVT